MYMQGFPLYSLLFFHRFGREKVGHRNFTRPSMTQDETQNPEVVPSTIYLLLFVRYVTYRLSKFPF